MTRAAWTYEVPEAGASAAGLEDYVVETADGELAGKVIALLRRGRRIYVAVERGTPPLRHDLRALPWGDVAEVDHSALKLRLRLDETALEESVELDPAKRVEGEDAEAVLVTELPPALASSASPDASRPADRPTYLAALGAAALAFILVLGVLLAAMAAEASWLYALLAVPAVLLALSAWLALRTYRAPYEG
jgi:hypothetical protein